MSAPSSRPAVEGPAAWRPADLADPSTYVVELTPAQVAELEAVGERLVAEDVDLRTVTPETVPLPRTRAAIGTWAEELDHGRGFVVTRGLNTPAYPTEVSVAILFALGVHLGVPMPQNAAGVLIDHVVSTTTEDFGDEAGSARSTARLVFHSDSSDVVALLCVRPAVEGGASRLASASTIYNEVRARRPDLLDLLFEPFYFDWHLQDPTAPEPVYPSPVFSDVDGVLSMYAGSQIVFTAQSYDGVPRLTPEQAEALELVESIAEEPDVSIDIDFRPGDIQWLSNYSALHSRRRFTDADDPEQRRHLVRMWLRRDTGRPMVSPFGKPLDRFDASDATHPFLSQAAVIPERVA
ncbi:MAG: TauD/TfdA family dioxygenase [Actinomycetota bacterium]|nr:TauD/TfdA family dioxygenase [Actinomycetota bacterium]